MQMAQSRDDESFNGNEDEESVRSEGSGDNSRFSSNAAGPDDSSANRWNQSVNEDDDDRSSGYLVKDERVLDYNSADDVRQTMKRVIIERKTNKEGNDKPDSNNGATQQKGQAQAMRSPSPVAGTSHQLQQEAIAGTSKKAVKRHRSPERVTPKAAKMSALDKFYDGKLRNVANFKSRPGHQRRRKCVVENSDK